MRTVIAIIMVGCIAASHSKAQQPSLGQQYLNLMHQQDTMPKPEEPFYNRPPSTPDIPYNPGYQVGPPTNLREGLSQQPATQGLPGPSAPAVSSPLQPHGPWNTGH
jgi:hypothetical protein